MKRVDETKLLVVVVCLALNGCWVAAGAAGAEAGYVASQDDRSAGQTIDDQVIVASIKTKLLADPDVSGLKINVDSTKGKVQLRGYAQTQREINRAIELAQATDGVKSVESRMVLDRQ